MVFAMNKLRELREDSDMTLAAVGAAVGTSAMSISYYERGERSLTEDFINKFCTLYGVTSDYLLGRSTWRTPVVSKEDSILLATYRAAPVEIRNIVDAALEPYKARASADSAAS